MAKKKKMFAFFCKIHVILFLSFNPKTIDFFDARFVAELELIRHDRQVRQRQFF